MKQAKKYLIISFLMLIAVLSPISASAAGKVKISKSKVTLTAGKSTTLKLKNNKKNVTWSSSNKKIATVNSKGKVTAKKKGTAKITAKAGGKKYTCKITVKAAPKTAKKKTAKKTTPTETEKQTEEKQDVCKIYGHVWGAQVIDVMPTCGKEGKCTYTCTKCGSMKTETLPKAINHTWQTVSHHAPTQKENWVCDTVKCTVCGATSEEKCLNPGAKGHPDYWTLPGGEAEALNRIKLYRQNQDKIHDPNNYYTSNCEGWCIELMCYIWQINMEGVHWFAPEGSYKNCYPTGDPGLQYYAASTFDPLYDLRVGDAFHVTKPKGHWLIIIDIKRDASGKMIAYNTAECGEINSTLHGIPSWHDNLPDCDPNDLVRSFNNGRIDQVMTMWPDIWTRVQ